MTFFVCVKEILSQSKSLWLKEHFRTSHKAKETKIKLPMKSNN